MPVFRSSDDPSAWPVALALGIGAVAGLVLGWAWGYRSVSGYLKFWIITGITLSASTHVARRWSRWSSSGVDTLITSSVTAFAIVVGSGLLLGVSGQLRFLGFLTLAAAAWIAAHRVSSDSSDPPPADSSPMVITPWIAGVLGAVAAFVIAFGIAHLSMTLYDSLSYHLFFPARWLQDRAISIVPTPFSDEAQAYAPANGELFLLWLMLPFHGDIFARIGQAPFLVLGMAALYALSRRLGASSAHAVYPAAFFALSRPVVEQAVGANVDLICAAMFVTALYLGIVATDRNRPRDWALWGVSVGLYAGTKYVALVYLPVLLVMPFLRRPSWARLAAIPGIAAFGAPWYLRNWIVAGSPLYPASMTLGPLTIARGAFDRAAMFNTIFHTADTRLIPIMAAHLFGPALSLVWIPVAIAGGWTMCRRGWWPHGFVFAAPFAMSVLYWFGIPVNIDSRFLLPAVAPALVPFAFAIPKGRALGAVAQAAYAAAMGWLLVGNQKEITDAGPWFMRGWTSLAGIVSHDFLLWYGGLAVLIAFVWWIGPSTSRWAPPMATAMIAVPAVILALGGEHWCIPSRCDYLRVTSPHIPMDLIYGWRWIDDNAHAATIAYTGINLPYPLTGERLANRVVYANIDGRPDWRFHDYDRAKRAGHFRPPLPALATASGELLPAVGSGASLRPRYERMEGIPGAWTSNLRRLGVGYLFVSMLSSYEIDNVWHDEQGFPIERTWAAAEPDTFHLAYENPQVRIFAVNAGGPTQ